MPLLLLAWQMTSQIEATTKSSFEKPIRFKVLSMLNVETWQRVLCATQAHLNMRVILGISEAKAPY